MQDIKKIYEKSRWYAQGIIATPPLIGASGTSVFTLNKILGITYSHFLFHFKNDQAEMLYDISDFEKLWQLFHHKIVTKRGYLESIKNQYDANFESFLPTFNRIRNENVEDFNDGTIVRLLHTSVYAQQDSVGLGHILEPISIVGSDVMRERVMSESVSKRDLNQVIANLFEPTEKSFLAREEDELFAISKFSKSKQESHLQRHLERYYWLENTYASTDTLAMESLKERMQRLQKERKRKTETKMIIDKERVMRTLGLSPETKRLIFALNFCTIWQDERKIKILRALSALDKILREIARRTNIDQRALRYLGVYEALSIEHLSDIKRLSDKLVERRQGCYYYVEKEKERFITLEKYITLFNLHHRKERSETQQELRGMTANLGTAIGEVKICITVASLKDFPKGAVLVAHMTRPEYAIVMKRASAIITDEGGITSHAAIVSRELDVPCIIGTKNATRILKDGDLVEVRANHGFIRILKKAK